MTASQQAKTMGFKSLQQVAEIFGVTATCLRNWHNEQPEKFKIVLLGCMEYKQLID